jgi:hypothetical protein
MVNVSLAADNASGPTYLPQLAPKFGAGETFSYHATAEFDGLLRITDATKSDPKHTGVLTRSDKVLRSEQTHFSAELISDSALAKSVFKNGSLHEAVFLVKHCVITNLQGKTTPLVPDGSIIGARKQADGQVAFAVNGKLPDPELAARLSVLILMGDEAMTANDLLGPPKPEPVGASWAVNEKAMLKSDLPRIFPGLDRLAGNVVLSSAKPNSQGVVQTTVTSTYRLGDVKPPFPPDVIVNPSNVRFQLEVTAPITGGAGQYDVQTSVLIQHTGHTGDIQVGMSETDMKVGYNVEQQQHYVIGGAIALNPALAATAPIPDLPPVAPGMSSAPVFRPEGPVISNHRVTTESVPDPASVKPKPSTAPERPQSAPPLMIPPNSPFSNAQDLPSQPAK